MFGLLISNSSEMKKHIFSFLAFLFCIPILYASEWITINTDRPVPARVQLISSNIERSVISFTIDGYIQKEVETPRGSACIVGIEEGTPILKAGDPDLPKLSASLIIPDKSHMTVKVISTSYKDFEDIEVAPSKGNFTRDIDPASVPYIYGKSYNEDSYFPGVLAKLQDPYILRDWRGQTVIIYPFQYNPVTKTLRVYYEITVEVIKEHNSGLNPYIRVEDLTSVDVEFKNIYNRHFLNATQSRYAPVDDQGNMLIISYSDFMDEMEPFINWKIKAGMQTEIIDVSEIGGSSAIKTYVEDYYNNNGLTFLLLVGDADQVPTHSYNGVSASDNSYGYITGDDSYPELFVGRFSAETPEELITQVERTIKYEQDPLLTTDWFTYGVGIASNQGPGDDGEMDYEHVRNLQADLLNYTYTYCSELFDGTQGGEDLPGNPSPTLVTEKVNEGASVILYAGHGSTTSWGTSGFSNTYVNALTNTNLLPFIWSVACWNGAFVGNTCFAEAWLRATDTDGEPTGAIAGFMSTISQSWDPPMEGQDEMVAIMVESYQDNIKRTFGGISMNGCMQMNDAYGASGSHETDAWTCFGDPSLVIRTAFPVNMAIFHNGIALIGSTQFTVTCDVEGALAALTKDSEIIGSAYVEGGLALIEFEPLLEIGTMDLVVTAYNHLPYDAEVDIEPADGPYVIFDSYIIKDESGNGDGKLDYGEVPFLDLGVYNIGTEGATNVEVTIGSADPFVTISDNSENYGDILSGETKVIESAFSMEVAGNVPNHHIINFELTASDGNREVWNSNFTIAAHAPILELGYFVIEDPDGNNNGKLDPGETAQFTINIANPGSSQAYDVTGILSTEDTYISIEEDTFLFGDIPAGESVDQVYNVTADYMTPLGHSVLFDLEMNADLGVEADVSFSTTVGHIPVLVIDLDGNLNSGPSIVEAINNLGIASEYLTSLPDELNLYSSVFLCLGIYSNNHILTDSQGQILVDYLNNGGCLYMEGGDTWAYNTPTPVHSMFNIIGTNDGSGNMNIITGQVGSFTENMEFSYVGENSYMDQIDPVQPAFSLFMNSNPIYGCAIAYDAGAYKTIGTSYEFGGLVDDNPPSTKENLISTYLEFFNVIETLTGDVEGTVTDAISGLAVEGAEVYVGIYKTTTQSNGTYSGSFPVGEWSICVYADGYETMCDVITIHEDSTITKNFALNGLVSPTNLTAQLDENIVTLDWEMNMLRSFQYFCIYRSKEENEFEMIGTSSETTYEDLLSEAGMYSYYITALFDGQSESLPTNIATIEYTATGIQDPDKLPSETRLGNCYPNPFHDETSITFTLKEDQDVLIEIYKLTGQKIRTLVDQTIIAGFHEAIWDCIDDRGQRVTKGVYFYNMKAGRYSSTKKMILMR